MAEKSRKKRRRKIRAKESAACVSNTGEHGPRKNLPAPRPRQAVPAVAASLAFVAVVASLVLGVLFVDFLVKVHVQVGFFFTLIFIALGLPWQIWTFWRDRRDETFVLLAALDFLRWSGAIAACGLCLWAATALMASLEGRLPWQIAGPLWIVMFLLAIRVLLYLLGLRNRK